MTAPPRRHKTAAEHARPTPEQALAGPRAPLVLVLENIRSGGNVGSVLRTADGFALEAVLLAGYTPAPPHREILKTSLGAEASVPWRRVGDLAAELSRFRENGYRVAALEQTPDARMLGALSVQPSDRWVVVLGNEVRGVTPETLALVDEVIEIPQAGAKQSLNVSVAAGVLAWELAG